VSESKPSRAPDGALPKEPTTTPAPGAGLGPSDDPRAVPGRLGWGSDARIRRRFEPRPVEINPAWARWIDQRDGDEQRRLEQRVGELEGLLAALVGKEDR
jgi:hypothetical protein